MVGGTGSTPAVAAVDTNGLVGGNGGAALFVGQGNTGTINVIVDQMIAGTPAAGGQGGDSINADTIAGVGGQSNTILVNTNAQAVVNVTSNNLRSAPAGIGGTGGNASSLS
jgi:hypothetical protein